MLMSQVCMTLLKAVTEIILGKAHLYLELLLITANFGGFLILFIFEADPRGNTVDFKCRQQQSKDFSWFEIFNFRMLLGRKILARNFWGSLI